MLERFMKNVKHLHSFETVSTFQIRKMAVNRSDNDQLLALIDKYSFDKYYLVSYDIISKNYTKSHVNFQSYF